MDILYTVKSVTGALRRWVEANPELTGTLMKASAVVAAVTVGLGTLAVALAAVLGPLAVIRLGFSVLGIKTLPSVTAAVTRTSSALSGWLAHHWYCCDAGLLHRATLRVYLLHRCHLCAARHH